MPAPTPRAQDFTVEPLTPVHHYLRAVESARDAVRNGALTKAVIAREITGARRGRPFGKRFWDELAFTRVIAGGRDFRGMKKYLHKNAAERDFGTLARKTIEEYERAQRIARGKGVDVWRVLERLGPGDLDQIH